MLTTPDSVMLFKALGDASRLKMLVLIQEEGPLSTEVLCERLKLVPSTVSHHVKKLVQAQVVSAHKENKTLYYSVKKEVLEMPLQQLIQPTDFTDGRSERYKNKVLETFISCGQLLKIPSQRKKRRIVLEHILQTLDAEKTYHEKELSEILARWNEDYCFLRREMIAEGLLSREAGMYQRILDAS